MHILALILLAAMAAACASTGAVPRPFPTPGGASPPARPAESSPEVPTTPIVPRDGIVPERPDGYAVAGAALSLRGVPYANGGTTPAGFDCSGLVQYVFNRYGLEVPREVRDQYRMGKKVARDRLEPGDLVFFSTVSRGASHVGIALGGDQFVHAPSERGVVRVEHLSAPYWASRFIGARRVVN